MASVNKAVSTASEVCWLDKASRLDALCDRLSMCAVALHGAKPEDRGTLGSIIVELRGITLELESLRHATD